MAEDPPLDRTLDPAAFYSLYRGTLAAWACDPARSSTVTRGGSTGAAGQCFTR
jgi:hypothetical protein